jgi:UDP-glucuronate 4-epimerase
MKILITGTAGFIGFHFTLKLLEGKHDITGLDCINDYYDINLKHSRLKESGIEKDEIEYGKIIQSNKYSNYKFTKLPLEDKENIFRLFKNENFDIVCHLAAQAGVRYSLENPYTYIDSNISGFLNILEACRHNKIKHLIFASSSSVYGLNESMPFSTSHKTDQPVSLYGATKKANELMAHSYSHLFSLPVTGLRFFTVYGPWGRPDMFYFKLTKSIIENKPVDIFNYGNMERDFTYIDDIVTGIIKVIEKPPVTSLYRIYNLGHNKPVKLIDFIETIEECLDKKAIKKMLPLQPGDVLSTWADIDDLIKDFDYRPETSIEDGIKNFINWYLNFYK